MPLPFVEGEAPQALLVEGATQAPVIEGGFHEGETLGAETVRQVQDNQEKRHNKGYLRKPQA
jgi:hypothetical protein